MTDARGDTSMGGPAQGFPATRLSAVRRLSSADPEERARSWDRIVAAYWRPAYKYLRLRWNKSNEDAKDLCQTFFSLAIEGDWFESFDPSRARFRTFFRVCLDRYLAKEGEAARCAKRGGRVQIHSLDFDAAEAELSDVAVSSAAEVEAAFDREWVRDLIGAAVAELERECRAGDKLPHFRAFERYDLAEGDPPTYAQLAAELGIAASDVSNRLTWARRRFRDLLLETLYDLTATEEEFQAEASELLGGGTWSRPRRAEPS